MVLLALAFAGCRGKSSQLADFNKQLYAPEYASGFKIERADGRQSVLVSVMNPWQGADSVRQRIGTAHCSRFRQRWQRQTTLSSPSWARLTHTA